MEMHSSREYNSHCVHCGIAQNGRSVCNALTAVLGTNKHSFSNHFSVEMIVVPVFQSSLTLLNVIFLFLFL